MLFELLFYAKRWVRYKTINWVFLLSLIKFFTLAVCSCMYIITWSFKAKFYT